METIERDYSPKGVKFYYVYKALAHPEYDGYVTPYSLEERLMHLKEAERRLGSRITWLADNMDNSLKHAMGGMPNSEVIVDPSGRVVRSRVWSDPDALRKDLAGLVGPVANPTRVEDLNMPTQPPPATVAKGVVPRVEIAGVMQALRIEPEKSDKPHYVKLRAEVEPKFFEAGASRLYIGFHLDPLYRVHWNNLVEPLSFEIQSPDGVTITPSRAQGPKVGVDADADPREFLLDIKAEKRDQPLRLTVRYYGCDDDDTFCIKIEQGYTVRLERDPDGGGAPGRWVPPRSAMMDRIMQFDKDGDGRISRDEVPARLRNGMFDRMDGDGDGYLTRPELEAAVEQMRKMRGAGPR